MDFRGPSVVTIDSSSLSVPVIPSGAPDSASAKHVIFLANNESLDLTPGELIPTLLIVLKDMVCSESPAKPYDLLSHHISVHNDRF